VGIINKCIFILICILFIKFKLNKKNLLTNYSNLTTITKIDKLKEEFIKKLKIILKEDEIIENVMMNKYTTFKIGGVAKFLVTPKEIKQIIKIIKLCNKYKINYFILGNGSNLLVSDTGYNGVIIHINQNNFSNLEVIKKDENTYILKTGGGMLMKTLSIEACLLSLTGLEDIVDIPGTIGGGIIMNASFKGDGLKNPLSKVKIITPEGKILYLTKEECKLRPRGSILKDKKYLIIEAIFELKKGDQMIIQKTMTDNTKMRYENQPMYFGSAGSFFIWHKDKNGSLYEKYKECNLVGYRIGDIMIYTYNIAFIVNLGKGTASQVMDIVTHVEKIMKDKYNIEIQREVIVI
jgi:UDP-N-acetylmuramate dehydrogenase